MRPELGRPRSSQARAVIDGRRPFVLAGAGELVARAPEGAVERVRAREMECACGWKGTLGGLSSEGRCPRCHDSGAVRVPGARPRLRYTSAQETDLELAVIAARVRFALGSWA